MREVDQELEYIKFSRKEDIRVQFRMLNLGLIAVVVLFNALLFGYLFFFNKPFLMNVYSAFYVDRIDVYLRFSWYMLINLLTIGLMLLACNRFEFSALRGFNRELNASDSLTKLTVLSEEYPKFSQILKMKINEKGFVSERDYSDLKVNQLYEIHLSNKCKMTLMSGLLK